MKRNFLLFFVIIISIISCEEGFEPTAEFREDYVMFGVINGDTTYQTVIISKSYEPDNFNPYANTNDPDIRDAVVTITGRDKEYVLRDTSIERADKSRYTTDEYFYYTDEFKPKIGEEIELRAVLPNGKVLTSKTKLPGFSLFSWTNSDEALPINKIYSQVLFTWKLNNASDNLVFLPRFLIHYYEKINGVNVKKEKEIPLELVKLGSSLKELFPSASGKDYVLYDTTIVYDTFKELKGSGNPSDITIINGEVELTVMDKNLGSYYSSIQTLNDGYTIKIYETNYSNIEGGIGILGSYFTFKRNIEILHDFIGRFGYNF